MLKGIEFFPEYAKVQTWLQKLLKTLKVIVNNSSILDVQRVEMFK